MKFEMKLMPRYPKVCNVKSSRVFLGNFHKRRYVHIDTTKEGFYGNKTQLHLFGVGTEVHFVQLPCSFQGLFFP